MSPSGPSNLILAAFLLNAAVAVAKLFVSALTGSGAVLAEFMHSIAMTTSVAILLVAMRRAMRTSEPRKPPRAQGELHFWALVAPILIYSLGAGVALNEGATWLQTPRLLVDLPSGILTLGVLLLVQAGLAVIAWRRAEISDALSRVVVHTLAVQSFAAAASLGATVAGLGAVYAFGTIETDAFAAITVGLIMGAVAAMMALATRKLLVGSAPAITTGTPPDVDEETSGRRRVEPALADFAFASSRSGKGKKKRRR